MLFGQSLFQSVLTRLDEEEKQAGEDAAQDAAGFRVTGLNTGFVAAVDAITPIPASQANDAYRDGLDTGDGYDPDIEATDEFTQGEMPGTDDVRAGATPAGKAIPSIDTLDAANGDDHKPPPPSDHERLRYLARISHDEIAEDLALEPADTLATLTEKRRLFARKNHPDSVPEDFRAAANTRMKIANRLIDDAIRRAPPT